MVRLYTRGLFGYSGPTKTANCRVAAHFSSPSEPQEVVNANSNS
jgi:hypothetical protein